MTKKIKAAVVGVHGFGKFHAEEFAKNELAELVAVCDINEEYARECGEKYAVKYVTNFDDILNDPNINAVSIDLQVYSEFCKSKRTG